MNPDTLRFDSDGLIPGIVQDRAGTVRMVAWLNREALRLTLETGFVTFWSRSRQAIWTKGESSGNRLKLIQIRPDCDADALLILADPEGPSCHRGTESCFDAEPWPVSLPWLGRLEALLKSRKAAASLDGSYTQKLFAQGVDRIAKKVVEEAGEVILAAKNDDREAFLGEAADLLFHLDLLLLERGASLLEVVEVLHGRHAERGGGPA
ncbi:MAG: bifunctional phosphoribosyl-AMP cyclohydrolase/phosphoribosyl-ATP diphosphatase HisIE [Geothrix sp.]|jgi:phosphoribosyl-ATP pyrophosphohydrolase/phosphoribosyl-AMP cyclohydrolase|uniref:Histidine biosynthesis bifunctional protein HisIE n=1 Tax=Candidatus Geothrix odensensis TaxID=2954440 RepID=A0A936EZ85_9BACT|nr:bifunctional phosphoribosyl-AMP cyclohydrolase/phosphoribosyl-ATP diphosphatase HisIE [Candidatus Geothrix odensensis]MBP7617724.1 bifunctional phosphoribosyl-AMP cyclohydrolase/phosphoribosyl-ATP diphosphatase HisIE [Geothrix sp.]MCC6512889.1 bifunctional phosphoribosyl-AMP cyclohydrolase/phosphoribosyl-ATP diphosphatase HisIE [Geothrix sp.]